MDASAGGPLIHYKGTSQRRLLTVAPSRKDLEAKSAARVDMANTDSYTRARASERGKRGAAKKSRAPKPRTWEPAISTPGSTLGALAA